MSYEASDVSVVYDSSHRELLRSRLHLRSRVALRYATAFRADGSYHAWCESSRWQGTFTVKGRTLSVTESDGAQTYVWEVTLDAALSGVTSAGRRNSGGDDVWDVLAPVKVSFRPRAGKIE